MNNAINNKFVPQKGCKHCKIKLNFGFKRTNS